MNQDQFYPGSTQRIGATLTEEASPVVLQGGREYQTPGGKVTLYNVGDLAVNLNRSPATVRRWERDGVLPKATYSKRGKDNKHGRRRLYSKEQISGLRRIAGEEGLLDNPKMPIARTKFTSKAVQLFKELARK